VLLPLRDVEGARRVRENVRDAEVCVALVGYVLCAAEEQGFEGCDEDGTAVSSAWAGGAGGGGYASDWRVAVAVRFQRHAGGRLRLGRTVQSEILRFAQDDNVCLSSGGRSNRCANQRATEWRLPGRFLAGGPRAIR
jgi:hypothetical protein